MSTLHVPVLLTPRLRLSPLCERDGPGMFELWSAREVCLHNGRATDCAGRRIELPVRSQRDSARLLEYWLRRHEDGTGFRWSMRLREDDAFVGALGFNELGVTPELAYHMLPARWGEGLMLEGARAALTWCFGARGSAQVVAYIDPANTRSLRLAGRLGMERHGAARDETERYALRAARWLEQEASP